MILSLIWDLLRRHQGLRLSSVFVPLLICELQAVNATRWGDLDRAKPPDPSSITLYENSTLAVKLSNFGQAGQSFGGNLTLADFNLDITADLVRQGTSNATTLYALKGGTTEFVGRQGKLSITLQSTQGIAAKSIFDIDVAGSNQASHFTLNADTTIRLNPGMSVFSIFRVGGRGTLEVKRDLDVDLSQATGSFPEGNLKAIFDINKGGKVEINRAKNSTIKLKGDVFNNGGTLNANFSNGVSLFEGTMYLKGGSKTDLEFADGAQMKAKIEANNNLFGVVAGLKLRGKSGANLQSTIDLTGDLEFQIDLDSATFESKLTASLPGKFNNTFTAVNNSTIKGDFVFRGSTKLKGSINHSSFKANITAEDTTALDFAFRDGATAEFNLNAKESSAINFSFLESTYKGKINIDATGLTGNFTFNRSSAEFELNINNGAPTINWSASGGSNLKGNIAFLDKSDGATARFFLDDSKWYGVFKQGGKKPRGDLKISNKGVWYMLGDSGLDVLEVSNPHAPTQFDPSAPYASVDLKYSDVMLTERQIDQIRSNKDHFTLKSESIRGNNGVFRIRGVLDRASWLKMGNKTIATDQITTQSVEGTHHIQILWNPNKIDQTLLTQNLYQDHIVIATQTTPTLKGDFKGMHTTVGVFDYDTELTRVDIKDAAGQVTGYEWILGAANPHQNPHDPNNPHNPHNPHNPPAPPPPPPPPPRVALDPKVLNTLADYQYNLHFAQIENLQSRMGDLRNIKNSIGAWAKIKYGSIPGTEGEHRIEALSSYTGISLGADYELVSPMGKNYLGFGFSTIFFQAKGAGYEGGDPSYEMENTAYGFALYDTYLFDNGLYFDSWVKYSLAKHAFSLHTFLLGGNHKEFKTHNVLLGLEFGKKFRLPIPVSDFNRNFYYLKPEVGVDFGVLQGFDARLHHLGGYDFETSLDLATPTHIRLLLDIGKRFDSSQSKILGDLFASIGGEYHFSPRGALRIQTPLNEVTLRKNGFFNLKLGAGGNIIFNDYARLYGNIVSRFLGETEPTVELNLGVRVIFGRIRANLSQLSRPIIWD